MVWKWLCLGACGGDWSQETVHSPWWPRGGGCLGSSLGMFPTSQAGCYSAPQSQDSKLCWEEA